jgi:hypothetical protein
VAEAPYHPRRAAPEPGPPASRPVPTGPHLAAGPGVPHLAAGPGVPHLTAGPGVPHLAAGPGLPSGPHLAREPGPGGPGGAGPTVGAGPGGASGPGMPTAGARPGGATGPLPPANPHRGTAQVPRPSPYPRVPPPPGHWTPAAQPEWSEPRRSANGSGQSSRRSATDARRTPLWVTVVGVLAVAVLAGVCAAGGYIMFTHPASTGSSATPTPARAKPRDISSRAVDAAPLTAAELFPKPTVPPGYQVLKTQAGDCAPAAVGEPAKVLGTAGCNQLVRATLVSADKVFVVTAGLLNLATQDGAQQANEALGTAVGAQKGRFTGFDAGGPSAVFAKAATQLGWDARGHFLGYCVVARVDGKPLDGTDPAAKKVVDDLVEKYLLGTVVAARTAPVSPSHT